MATKKKESKTKAKEAAPAVPAAPKKHERKTKAGEADRLEKARHYACSYLERTQGLDPQTAIDVVESMSAEDVHELVVAANTEVIEQTQQSIAAAATPSPANAPATPAEQGATLLPAEPDGPPVEFYDVPEIMAFATKEGLTFAELMVVCLEASRKKNDAEKEYKTSKKEIIDVLIAAGTKRVNCMGIGMNKFKGNTPRQLDEIKLLEAGVDPDIIAACWKSTEYDDVRFTPIKEAQ